LVAHEAAPKTAYDTLERPQDEAARQAALGDPDVRLMLRAQADEPGAFEALVGGYHRRLVSVLYHRVGDQQEAEDLAQEVFLRVYQARQGYRPRARFSTWLFTIANNLALNSLRSRRRKPQVRLDACGENVPGLRPEEAVLRDPSAGPAQRAVSAELAERLHAALDTLKPRQRVVVVLNQLEGKSHAEVGREMNLSAKAVKSLLARARSNLHAALRDYARPDDARPRDGRAVRGVSGAACGQR
jgi:RNA polymerase sigma-70 factor (ECF subfamily)